MALLAILKSSANKTDTFKTIIALAKTAPATARNLTATLSAAKTAATAPASPVLIK
jgi:hypothetical protein